MASPFAYAADQLDPPPPEAWRVSPLAWAEHIRWKVAGGLYRRARHLDVIERETLATVADAGRLLLEVAIRSGKTRYLELFCAWFLATNPDKRIIWASHHADFASRRGRAIRDLFDQHAPRDFGLSVSRKSEAASRWDIAGRAGGLIAVGVGGTPIGEGADIGVIDDPLKSYAAAMSPIQRAVVNEWLVGTMFSRLEPGSAVLMALARWHEDDPGGYMMRELPDEWRSVRMPAICDDPAADPLGRAEGEPLWPERYPLAELHKRRKEMTAGLGEVVWLAQAQQRPSNPKGGMFPEDKWRYMRADELAVHSGGLQWVRSWDLAASADGGDFTVGALMTRLPDGRVVIADVRRGQWHSHRVRQEVDAATAADPPWTRVEYPQDPGQAGKDQAAQYATMLAGHIFHSAPVSGSKEIRAAGYAAQVQAEQVYLVQSEWNGPWIAEHNAFPRGSHDDQVDAGSSGFNVLVGSPLGPARGVSAAERRMSTGAALARRSGRRVGT